MHTREEQLQVAGDYAHGFVRDFGELLSALDRVGIGWDPSAKLTFPDIVIVSMVKLAKSRGLTLDSVLESVAYFWNEEGTGGGGGGLKRQKPPPEVMSSLEKIFV